MWHLLLLDPIHSHPKLGDKPVIWIMCLVNGLGKTKTAAEALVEDGYVMCGRPAQTPILNIIVIFA